MSLLKKMFSIDNLHYSYQNNLVLENINLKLKPNKITGIVGPNGAGKTTLLDILSGILTNYKQGNIFLNNFRFPKKMHQIADLGIVRTFQEPRLFMEFSVLENILAGGHRTLNYSLADSLIKKKSFLEKEKVLHKRAEQLLDFWDIKHLSQEKSKSISFEAQKKLEFSRAMLSSPHWILLDEPSAGVDEESKTKLMQMILNARKHSFLGVVLVDHNIEFIKKFCNEVFFLSDKKVLLKGTPKEVFSNKQIMKIYLGM